MVFWPVINWWSGSSARIEVLVSWSPFNTLAELETWSQSNQNELYNEVSPETAWDALRVATAVADWSNYEWQWQNKVYSANSWVNTSALSNDEKKAVDSIINLTDSTVPISKNNILIDSIQTQDWINWINFDWEITTTKWTLNIWRGLSISESWLSPIFRDVLEDEAWLPTLTPVHWNWLTDDPCYIRRYWITDEVIQSLEDEVVTWNWEAIVPVTFTRILTKLRVKFDSNCTGVRLTLRFASNNQDKTNTILYQSHTDAQFKNWEWFSINKWIFEIDFWSESWKLIKDTFVYIVLEQNTQWTWQIDLKWSTLDIWWITQFYAYLEQTYVLEEKRKLATTNINWKQIESDYIVLDWDVYLDVLPTWNDIVITIDNSYNDDWSWLFIYNKGAEKKVISNLLC